VTLTLVESSSTGSKSRSAQKADFVITERWAPYPFASRGSSLIRWLSRPSLISAAPVSWHQGEHCEKAAEASQAEAYEDGCRHYPLPGGHSMARPLAVGWQLVKTVWAKIVLLLHLMWRIYENRGKDRQLAANAPLLGVGLCVTPRHSLAPPARAGVRPGKVCAAPLAGPS
jgi:hypothetical protein